MSEGRPRKALELYSVEQMYKADALTIDGGVPGTVLMDRAGRAVANVAADLCAGGRILVLCGPGNNGGDGFIAARALSERNEAGWRYPFDLRVALLGDVSALEGDAKWAAEQWLEMPEASIEPLTMASIGEADLIIDALFGAGLARPIDGPLGDIIGAVNDKSQCTVVSVDVPSGVDGNTGAVKGVAVKADRTVTFHRMKPGHLLMPGRDRCGPVDCADIGISEDATPSLGIQTFHNCPDLWRSVFRRSASEDHKYSKGHAVVFSGGPGKTGAARLAAVAALRAGAGLVTVAAPFAALGELSAQLTSVMTMEVDQVETVQKLLADDRNNAIAIGPGFGLAGVTKDYVLTLLDFGRAALLDADALTAFVDGPGQLFERAGTNTVITPHMGEFGRLFPDLKGLEDGRVAAARRAAERLGGTVVLKGPDTVIACHDGRAAINANAPASLATAGSGDVLAGIITGLLAQNMPPWEAACAGVWLHGACGQHLGHGLIAEDLPWALPDVLESPELRA